jgi:hypothetical protein
MDRRAFVVGAVAALGAPLGFEAAQGTRTPRIGYLTGNSAGAALDLEFIRGLRELGWVDGHNVSIEARYYRDVRNSFLRSPPSLFVVGSTS